MGMIADMVAAVAIIAITPGAVTELQLGIRHIGSAADSTAVGIGFFGNFLPFPLTATKANYFWLWGSFSSLSLHSPGGRKQIQNILTKEQKVIQDCNQREQIMWKRKQRIR